MFRVLFLAAPGAVEANDSLGLPWWVVYKYVRAVLGITWVVYK